jgi:hypothetical protein
MGNVVDLINEQRRSEFLWDAEHGWWNGVWRCRGCGRFLGRLIQVRSGGQEAPPCRTKTCAGYINRLGFETVTSPTK